MKSRVGKTGVIISARKRARIPHRADTTFHIRKYNIGNTSQHVLNTTKDTLIRTRRHAQAARYSHAFAVTCRAAPPPEQGQMLTRMSTKKVLETDTLTSIYGAALSSNLWDEVIDRCAAESEAFSGAFLTQEVGTDPEYSLSARGALIREKIRTEPELLTQYISDISPLESIILNHLREAPSRKIWLVKDAWPAGAEAEAELHAEWIARHLGVGPMLIASLNENPRINEMFILHFRLDETLPTRAVSTFELLLPHLAKSAEMSVLYSSLQRRYSAILTVLNKVGIGLCVLDKAGNILVNNDEATRMLSGNHGITLSNNRFICNAEENQARMDAAISRAILGQSVVHAESLVAVRRDATQAPLLVEVSPLRDALDELDFGYDGVLVQMIDTDSRSFCSTAAFSLLYELTHAENSVVELVLDGLTNKQIAEHRGTTPETVKTQIAHIMKKTQSRSRVELVRRILKTQPPIDVTG